MDKRRLIYVGSILLAVVLFYISFVALYKTSGLDLVIDAVRQDSAPIVKVTSINVFKHTVDGKKLIKVEWNNLPEGTTAIDIYRSREGSWWEKWQTIPIGPGQGGYGSAEFEGSGSDDPYEYFYYEEAIGGGGNNDNSGGGGEILWTSSSTQPVAPPPPPETSTTSTGSGTENPGSNPPNPGDTGSTPTSTTETENPTSTTSNPPPSGGESTSTVYYYSPSGEITGSSTVGVVNDFSVHHLNNKIQIEWRNLPANTDTVLISRAQNQSGPWSDLIRRTGNPVSGEIGLLDQTVGQTFYYKLTAYANSVVVATAGPVRLDPE